MIGVAYINSRVCGINIYEAEGIKTAPSVCPCVTGTGSDVPEYPERCLQLRLCKINCADVFVLPIDCLAGFLVPNYMHIRT